MKRIGLLIIFLVLAGCGKNDLCQVASSEQLVLHDIQLLEESRVAGLTDRQGFESSLNDVRLSRTQPDRVVCEGTLNIRSSLEGFAAYFSEIQNRDPFDWNSLFSAIDIDGDEKWEFGFEGLFGQLLRSEFMEQTVSVSAPVIFALELDQQGNAVDFIGIEEVDRGNSLLQQVAFAAYAKVKEQLAIDEEAAELARAEEQKVFEAEALAMGFASANERREVEDAIELARRELEKLQRERDEEQNLFDRSAASIVRLEGNLASLSAEYQDLEREASQFQQALVSRYFFAPSDIVQISNIEQISGLLDRPALRFEVRNSSEILLSSLRLNGIIWSENTGEVRITDHSVFLGRDGLQPGSTTTVRMDLTERMGRGPLDTPAFRSAQRTAGWLYMSAYYDGMRSRRAVGRATDPRDSLQQIRRRIASVQQDLETSRQSNAQAESSLSAIQTALPKAELALEQALSRMPDDA